MYNNKFIIGLSSNVPSIRVLKPPGGESHDFFGLKTRQDALLQSLKKTNGILSQFYDSKPKFKQPSFNDAEQTNLPKIKNNTGNMHGCCLKSSKGCENLLSQCDVGSLAKNQIANQKLKNSHSLPELLTKPSRPKYGKISILEKESKGLFNALSPRIEEDRIPDRGDVGIDDGTASRPTGVKKESTNDFDLGCSKRRFQNYTRRNIITGEGIACS